jgi:hypothetical protein
VRYAGLFNTKREAKARQVWVLGQLAAMRMPDIDLLAEESSAPTFREAAERWLASRIDVAENTKGNHRSAVAAIVPLIGSRRLDSIDAADVAGLVATLCETRRRETVRKMLLVLGMIFDHAGATPNPARDKTAVKLPYERKTEIVPPTADRHAAGRARNAHIR